MASSQVARIAAAKTDAACAAQQSADGDGHLEGMGAPIADGERHRLIERHQIVGDQRGGEQRRERARSGADRPTRRGRPAWIVFRQHDAVAHDDEGRAVRSAL